MKKSSFIGSVFLVIAAIVWGIAFTAQDLAAVHLQSCSVNAIRFLIGGIFLFLILPFLDRAQKNGRHYLCEKDGKKRLDFSKKECFGGILCGLILACAALSQQVAITAGSGAGKAAFLTALYILLVPVLSLAFGKKSRPLVWGCVLIALCGAYLLSAVSGEILPTENAFLGFFRVVFSSGFSALTLADWLLLLSALLFACHIVAIDQIAPDTDGVRLSMIQFFTASFVMAPFMIFMERPSFGAIFASALPLLYLGIMSAGIAYTFQILGQQRTDPTIASLVMSLESVFGLLGGIVILGERMSIFEIVGCVILFFAVILSQLPKKEKQVE
jgi:drug/metabolite transporter (DMT)-like permease